MLPKDSFGHVVAGELLDWAFPPFGYFIICRASLQLHGGALGVRRGLCRGSGDLLLCELCGGPLPCSGELPPCLVPTPLGLVPVPRLWYARRCVSVCLC